MLRALAHKRFELRKSCYVSLCQTFNGAVFEIGGKAMQVESVCMVQSKAAKAYSLHMTSDDVVYGGHEYLEILVHKANGGLCCWCNENVLNRDMRRTGGGKQCAFSNVTSGKGLIALIDC